MIEQTEKSFQKQPKVFLAKRSTSASDLRRVKNVGLGFVTPAEAYLPNYIDNKCPFTGNIRIRGRILTGIVKTMKMKNTLIMRRDYLHYVSKYQRYEKRHKNVPVHVSPCFLDIAVGDKITVGECRPLSKTVRFNVLKSEKIKVKGSKRFIKF